MRTTAMTEMIEAISAEVSQLQDFLAGLSLEEWSRPSACAGWTVGDVVAPLAQGARTWSEGITRAIAGDFAPPPGQRAVDTGRLVLEGNREQAVLFNTLFRGV